MRRGVGRLAIALVASACSLVFAAVPQEKPLPGGEAFLREARARLRSDAAILRRYSYRRSTVDRERDDDGRVVETHARAWQVRPLPDEPDGFRYLLVRDGRPEPPSVASSREAEYRQRLERARRAANAPGEIRRRQALAAQVSRDETATVADVVAMYEMRLAGRDAVGGEPCVRVTFAPRAGYVPRTANGRILQSVRGEACISESEYEIVRVVAQAVEPIKYGWGILARVAPGARAIIERRRIEGGAWVPVRYDFSGRARVLWVKTVEKDATVTFSDFEPAPPDAQLP